jgi:peptidoglycan/xylan/chitin deacetylase (PgdA/CDA1 family)
VLTYHGILPADYICRAPALDDNLLTASAFRNQLRFLAERHNIISPADFLLWCDGKHKLPPRSVLLTCDDGLRNNLTNMLPVLQEFRTACLFFVTGASLGDVPAMLWCDELYLLLLAAADQFHLSLPEAGIDAVVSDTKEKRELWWKLVKHLSPFEASHRRVRLDEIRVALGVSRDWNLEYCHDPAVAGRFMTLTIGELRQLASAGMSIGAHTMSHPMLSLTTPELAAEEICECHARLEQALGQTIWAIAYPFGDPSSVTDRELSITRDSGAKCAFVNTGARVTAESNRFALPRIHVTAQTKLPELEARISGLHSALQRRFAPQPAVHTVA